MKIGFFHDHIFHVNSKGDFFSPGKLATSSFQRYLIDFDELVIVSRFENNECLPMSGFNLINDDRISFIGIENLSNFKNRFLHYNKFKNKIKDIVSSVDAIVVRLPSEIGFLVAKICRELNIPYISEVVACPVDAMNGFNSIKSKLYKPIIKYEMENSVKHSFLAIYVTSEFLQERYPTDGLIASISNVEITSYGKVRSISNDKSIFSIAMIGNLDSYHKGYDTLYRALDKLNDKAALKIKIYLIGSGNIFIKNLRFSHIDVVYTGSLTKEEIIRLLDKVDLYVQPSNQEGLPRATIEAMSRGLPCVVSAAGGLPELIDSKYIHKVNDSANLALLCEQILSCSNEYNVQSQMNLNKSYIYNSDDLCSKRKAVFSLYKKYLQSKIET